VSASLALAPITNKVMRPTRRRGRERLECWGAETADGRFVFERLETTGTPWAIFHADTTLLVSMHGSLTKARRSVAAGHADATLAAMLEERAWA
jgi:hypothetical protein